jgi:hypothetical protein
VLRVSVARSICAECGHVWTWHDRDAARVMRSGELPSGRRCYREIGGAECRCNGFRDSGEIAVLQRPTNAGPSVTVYGLLALLLVIMGLALLYAYRSQSPSVASVNYSGAVREINAGEVVNVTIAGNKATLELRSGQKQQLILPDSDQGFQKVLTDYNAANPARPITVEYMPQSATLSVVVSIFLSLLPVLLLGGFFYFMMRRSMYR